MFRDALRELGWRVAQNPKYALIALVLLVALTDPALANHGATTSGP